jgi:DNA-binding CsgD family transcriptional regulator
VLVGRQAECARIEALVARARAGQGGALIVRGEPGIGKTALLGYAAERAEGMRVLHARGVEAEAELPFSGLHELARPLLDWLGGLPEQQAAALRDALALGPPVDARLQLAAGTLSLLALAAEQEGPLLVLVDDAHWLDAESAAALVFAARRLDADPVLILFGARDGDPRPFEPPGLAELVLTGLTREEAMELLRGEGLPERVVEGLHRAAAGNPLALLELPGVLTSRQRSGEEPLAEPLPVTDAVQAAFARRLEVLGPEVRQALLTAASEPSARLPLVERACELLALEPSALEDAEDGDLVRFEDGYVVFRHPLVRAAAYYSLRPAERRRAHRALAAASGETGAVAGRAWHLAAAAVGRDEEAAAALADAGDRARQAGALVSAARAYERSASLALDPDRRVRRLLLAARLRYRAFEWSDHDRARGDIAEALEQATDPRAAGELGYLAANLKTIRNFEAGFPLLLGQARALEAVDPELAARVASSATGSALRRRDARRALEASEVALSMLGGTAGDAPAFVRATGALALVLNGDLTAARDLRGALSDLLDALAMVIEEAFCDYTLEVPYERFMTVCPAMFLVGDSELIERQTRLLTRGRIEYPDDGGTFAAVMWCGRASWELGRWSDARVEWAEAEAIVMRLRYGLYVWYTFVNLARLAAAQGRETDARAYAERAAAVAAEAQIRAGLFDEPASGALALLELGAGDAEAAADRYEAEVLPAIGSFVLYGDVVDTIEALVRAGRLEAAAGWLESFAEQATAAGWTWALAAAAYLRGLLAGDDYARHFDEALALYAREPRPFLRARCELAYGERLRRTSSRREARARLRSALETFEQLGAAPWAERAAAELRATGERIRRRTDADTSRLTPQELQVALTVARGATNKQAAAQLYLSPKTIEKHLGSVYGKLGIRSRTELAAVFASTPAADAVPAPA